MMLFRKFQESILPGDTVIFDKTSPIRACMEYEFLGFVACGHEGDGSYGDSCEFCRGLTSMKGIDHEDNIISCLSFWGESPIMIIQKNRVHLPEDLFKL